jgi:hypothetical protein
MKKDEIQVGGTYLAKVGTRMVEVRVERENGRGGWDASSIATGKPVRLKDPKHLKPVKAKAATEAVPAPAAAQAGDAAPAAAPEARTPAPEPAAPTRAAKPRKGRKAAAETKPKAMSCLDAAATVLQASGSPMNCKAMVEAMAERGLWKSDAPTPAATLSSAILREMTKRGAAARFRKTSPGHFAYHEHKGD